MSKEREKNEQVNEPEYEHRLIQAVMELKQIMYGAKGYAG